MNRRRFLQSILAAGVAPCVMSSGIARGVLMPARKLWTPDQGLFAGEVGVWNNVKIILPPVTDLQWSEEEISAMRALGPQPLIINRIPSLLLFSTATAPRTSLPDAFVSLPDRPVSK